MKIWGQSFPGSRNGQGCNVEMSLDCWKTTKSVQLEQSKQGKEWKELRAREARMEQTVEGYAGHGKKCEFNSQYNGSVGQC